MQNHITKIGTYLLLLCAFSVLFLSVNISATATNGQGAIVREYVSRVNQEIANKIKANPELALSSNPYDYVKGNSAYKKLVDSGVTSVPALVNIIDSSSENGLTEYVCAMAAEEILQVNTKTVVNENYTWSNAKNWSRQIKKFANDVESNVNYISNKSLSEIEKKKMYDDLGILAVPYLDSIGKYDGTLSKQDITNINAARTNIIKGTN